MLWILRLRLWQLRKEYKLYLIMTAMSLVMAYVFAMSFGSSQNTFYTGALVITDGGRTQATFEQKAVLEYLDRSKTFKFTEMTYSDAKNKVENGFTPFAVIINPTDGTIKFMAMRKGIETMSLEREVTSALGRAKSENAFSKEIEKNLGKQFGEKKTHNVYESSLKTISNSMKYEKTYKTQYIVSNKVTNAEQIQTKRSLLLGMMLTFVAYSMVFGIGEILNEKKRGILKRIVVSPIKGGSIIASNLIYAFSIGMVQILLVMFLGSKLISVDFGNAGYLIILPLALFALTITSLGMMLASFLKNMGQLGVVAPILLTSFAMLGGCFWSIELMNNQLMELLAKFTPHYWAMGAINLISSGTTNLESLGLYILVPLIMSGIYFAIGVLGMTRKQ